MAGMSDIGPDLRTQLRTYVDQLAAEGEPEISILDGELNITWDRAFTSPSSAWPSR